MTVLDYEVGELPYVFVKDLNHDGAGYYLLTTPNSRLCGTGGCPYILIDGKSMKQIGDFFGAVAIFENSINHYPVIQTVSKQAIDTTHLNSFVFDGESYRLPMLYSNGNALTNGIGVFEPGNNIGPTSYIAGRNFIANPKKPEVSSEILFIFRKMVLSVTAVFLLSAECYFPTRTSVSAKA
jgi:hypothetical protein